MARTTKTTKAKTHTHAEFLELQKNRDAWKNAYEDAETKKKSQWTYKWTDTLNEAFAFGFMSPFLILGALLIFWFFVHLAMWTGGGTPVSSCQQLDSGAIVCHTPELKRQIEAEIERLTPIFRQHSSVGQSS